MRRAILAVVLLAGCSAPRPAPPVETPAATLPADLPRDGVASADGTYFVAFASVPSPIPANAEFALDVAVLTPDRRALVPDAALAIDATMPAHGHGMNVVPRVVPAGSGRFRVEGLVWHMSGAWRIDFDVTRGAVTERAQANVEID